MKKKLTCHCGEFEAEVTIPENGIEKVMRCNCTLCKRKGYVIGVLGENDFKIKQLFCGDVIDTCNINTICIWVSSS